MKKHTPRRRVVLIVVQALASLRKRCSYSTLIFLPMIKSLTKIAKALLLTVIFILMLSCKEKKHHRNNTLVTEQVNYTLSGNKLDTSLTAEKYFATLAEQRSNKLDKLVAAALRAHPNFKTNSIALKKAERALILFLAENTNSQLLENVPYNVLRLFKNPVGKGYILHIYTSRHANYEQQDGSNEVVEIGYDVLGKIPDSLATTVNENGTARIKCSNVKRLLTEKQIAAYVNQTYNYQLVRIGTEERTKVELGVFLCDIEALSPAFNNLPLAY